MPDGLLVAEHNLPAEFFVELEKQSDSYVIYLWVQFEPILIHFIF